jgi:hypothetical protein
MVLRASQRYLHLYLHIVTLRVSSVLILLIVDTCIRCLPHSMFIRNVNLCIKNPFVSVCDGELLPSKSGFHCMRTRY